jgi:hypothetical protein
LTCSLDKAMLALAMNREEAQEALTLLSKVVRQARDDTSLQNWGLIWITHAFTNGAGFVGTNVLMRAGYEAIWPYAVVWGSVLVVNFVTILMLKSATAGARTFIDNQVWIIWTGFILAAALTALVGWIGGHSVATLGPMIAVLAAFAFGLMGGVMGRHWFGASALFVVTAVVMAAVPGWQFVVMAIAWGGVQLVGGILLHRSKRQRLAQADGAEPRLV